MARRDPGEQVTVRWLDGDLGQLPATDWTGIPKPSWWDFTGLAWPPQGQFPTNPPPLWAQTGLPWPPPRPPGYPADWPFPLPVPPPSAIPPLPVPPGAVPTQPAPAPSQQGVPNENIGAALLVVAGVSLLAIILLR